MWIAYLEYHVKQNNPITMDEEVLDIDPTEFIMWYAQHNSRAATTTPAPSTSTPMTPTASRVATTSTDLFKCGIKHDPSLFPVMKQDSQFRQWKLHTISLVKAQDCTKVVDMDYIPRMPDKQALFAQKQIYMYSVFCHTLLTNIELKLVRDYEELSDAQSIFREFVAHYTAYGVHYHCTPWRIWSLERIVLLLYSTLPGPTLQARQPAGFSSML